MIAYKWVIKKDNSYFSLIGFGIHPGIKNSFKYFYELNKTYFNYNNNLRNKRFQKRLNIAGFHFWKYPKLEDKWKRYNKCLKHYNNPKINAILKCEINNENILDQDNEHIVANKFKILKEVIV